MDAVLEAVNRYRARKGLPPKEPTDVWFEDAARIIDAVSALEERLDRVEAELNVTTGRLP